MNGATSEVELVFDDVYPKVLNTMYDTKPLVLHGNGPSKRVLNTLTNYVPKAWNMDDQCTSCWEDTLSFEDFTEIPHIVIAIFIEKPTPFIEEFFEKIGQLEYDKVVYKTCYPILLLIQGRRSLRGRGGRPPLCF